MNNALIATAFSIVISSSISAEAARDESVLQNGDNIIEKSVGGHDVKGELQLHTIVSESDARCTGALTPCRVIDRLSISVDGVAVDVPRSVFVGLSDLTRWSLAGTKGSFVLHVHGGDASEAFDVDILFDARSVNRRKLNAAEFPEDANEVTTYYRKPVDPNL